jgi:micrococcal nuclease
MPTMNLLLIILFLLVLAALGRADKPGGIRARLDIDSKAYKTEVIDDDTVVMNNSPQVWLVGIQGPKLPLGRSNFKNGHSRTPENRHLRIIDAG